MKKWSRRRAFSRFSIAALSKASISTVAARSCSSTAFAARRSMSSCTHEYLSFMLHIPTLRSSALSADSASRGTGSCCVRASVSAFSASVNGGVSSIAHARVGSLQSSTSLTTPASPQFSFPSSLFHATSSSNGFAKLGVPPWKPPATLSYNFFAMSSHSRTASLQPCSSSNTHLKRES